MAAFRGSGDSTRKACLPTTFLTLTALVVTVGSFSSPSAAAELQPGRPIRILTSAAGGGADFLSRIVSQGISGPLGTSVVVDNRPGIVSTEVATKAAPDGHTLLFQLLPRTKSQTARGFNRPVQPVLKKLRRHCSDWVRTQLVHTMSNRQVLLFADVLDVGAVGEMFPLARSIEAMASLTPVQFCQIHSKSSAIQCPATQNGSAAKL